VRADADNPAHWTVATPTRVVLDVAWANGQIYAPVELGGLLRYDPDSGQIGRVTTADGLGSNLTRCIEVAPDGVIWVGTADAGITRIFPDGRMRFLTALPDLIPIWLPSPKNHTSLPLTAHSVNRCKQNV